MTYTLETIALVFGAGFLAGILNVMAAGGSLLTLPVLLFLGFPAALANGTNRVAILLQSVVAVWSFRRRGVRGGVRTATRIGLVALPGAIAGAFVALEIPDAWFRWILAAIIVGGVLTLAFPRPTDPGAQAEPPVSWVAYLAFFGIGFYGGFIQAGVGMLFLLVLHHLLHLDLVRVNAAKVFVVGIYTVPALAVFALSGNVDWRAGLVLATGNATGALVGTRLAVSGGDRVIRIVVAVALLLMAVRLVR